MKDLLLFGAGKIGRSFIAQLFSLGGYRVTFVDVNREIINAINQRGAYDVVIKSDIGNRILHIGNVRGLHFSQEHEIMDEIGNVELMATAVGTANLPQVLEMIGRGLKNRFGHDQDTAVDIIIAENQRNAAGYFAGHLNRYLSQDVIRRRVGLVETSIGKMVPIMTREDIKQDILRVFAEPYNTLILDGKGFRNPLPEVPGLAPKENMKAWVDRKSFIHNLGHAATAYYGYLAHPEQAYLYQVLSDRVVYDFAYAAMTEAASILISLYPEEFTEGMLRDHIRDLLERFGNRSLGDTVHRVGRDLYRKLGPEDRLAGAIRLAVKTRNSCDQILFALVCGYYFRAPDEKGELFSSDSDFAESIQQEGFRKSFEKVSNFNPVEHEDIIEKAVRMNQKVVSLFKI